jgi:hypothetical protein
MFHHNIDQITQEVLAKQARLQAEAIQERLAKLSADVGQTAKVGSQTLTSRSWFLGLPLRLVKQPK